MMNISIEIVPRNSDHIEAELKTIKDSFPQVNTINIPDILRLKVRSWQGSRMAKAYYSHVIPHIRAIDFDLNKTFPLIDELVGSDITSVLVVTGDAPHMPQHAFYPNKSVDLIRVIKQLLPHVKVYAAIDPYRHSFQEEYRYAMNKLEAGADGFFTQPFFDRRLMHVYADLLSDVEIFWGVAPVLTSQSKSYWETVNAAIFPNNFELSLEWNRSFAKEALEFAQSQNNHVYYMPIRVNLQDYLGGIL